MRMPNPEISSRRSSSLHTKNGYIDPLSEWKAKAATSNADTLAERVFAYWSTRDRTQVAGATSASKYRSHLREKVCSDFGLVWDVHDGHKHVTISRATVRSVLPNKQALGKWGGAKEPLGKAFTAVAIRW